MLFRILREVESDLRKFGAWYKDLGDAMKIFAPLVTIFVLWGGVYVTKDWWLKSTGYELLYISLPVAALAALLIGYLSIAGYRTRQPFFQVGELIADDSPGSHSFHIEVTNRGPGRHKPRVTITRLRDHRGKHLPGIRESYQPIDAHWRGCTGPDYYPELNVGETAYAGVLDVQDLNSDTPYLCTYPNELCGPRRLWETPTLLSQQPRLQLRINISYKSSKDVRITEQSYYVWPDPEAPLKYRLERVRKF